VSKVFRTPVINSEANSTIVPLQEFILCLSLSQVELESILMYTITWLLVYRYAKSDHHPSQQLSYTIVHVTPL